VQISPENLAIDMLYGMEEMVVVIPVDSNVDKAQDIAQEYGVKLQQCLRGRLMGSLQFKYNDGYDHGNHAITKCLNAPFAHASSRSTPKANPVV